MCEIRALSHCFWEWLTRRKVYSTISNSVLVRPLHRQKNKNITLASWQTFSCSQGGDYIWTFDWQEINITHNKMYVNDWFHLEAGSRKICVWVCVWKWFSVHTHLEKVCTATCNVLYFLFWTFPLVVCNRTGFALTAALNYREYYKSYIKTAA